ncbi:hypothetical protein THAR02_04698 [Trichoderma harzianum]|uniref:DUF6546 domain-containing protein n=1 Tax=Trichoderma harzianum TaxID=5544 RepID=A0A0G0ADV1_TRIHA|nr:hypothetical protein THAR02_04698 [Trichoderma harzianum]
MSTASPTSWAYLPAEIRFLVLEFLSKDGCSLSGFATVSREWQTIIEKHTFARITLTPFRLADFGPMIHQYDCTECDPDNEVLGISFADNLRVITTFSKLFTTLSTWKPSGSLVLDISVHSPADPLHWFRYLTFEPDVVSGVRGPHRSSVLSPLPRLKSHGWIGGRRMSAPNVFAFQKVFAEILGEKKPFDNDQQEEQWWQKLPVVPAVTAVLLRQQTRRRWKPKTLKYMLAHFPRLEDFHYEPWMEWYNVRQELTDRGCDPLRISTFEVSRAVAEASLKLEHLSASIMVDASYFFQAREPSWMWPNLTWFAMTSSLLEPDASPVEMDDMFIAAAAAARRMPNLGIMEIWNGQEGQAMLFRYQKASGGQPAVITCKGTWGFALRPAVIQAWEVIARKHRCNGCVIIAELIDVGLIQSQGDAIHHLQLSNSVMRPISLRQIRMEHRIRTGTHEITDSMTYVANGQPSLRSQHH